ncbi:hypothetical protein, partial [Mesorhizobium sp. M7A.F.Ca.CA.002.04.1.1]|uniref:hypothetical protein n=1 Tax=Mesorhizobium sp. M7A.F.Ca.CA.002.04.1.1 TaxID=2496681 RepID=UPI0019D4A9FA
EELDTPTSGAPAPEGTTVEDHDTGAARTYDGRSRRFSVLSCRQTNSAVPDHQEPHAEFYRQAADRRSGAAA